MTVREFHAHYRNDPGFQAWFEDAKLLPNIIPIIKILRLDLLGRTEARTPRTARERRADLRLSGLIRRRLCHAARPRRGRRATRCSAALGRPGPSRSPTTTRGCRCEVILDETGTNASSIFAGRETGGRATKRLR